MNEQLGQLYLDMQLAGIAEHISLEEGELSSESSGDENIFATKVIVVD